MNRRSAEQPRGSGQILVLFAIALTAILIALALLFDGAQSLVMRRQLQNSADSGALAGANIVQNGKCTTARISKTATDGSNDIYLAVRAKVVANLGWSTTKADAALTVTCATDQSWYDGYAVTVSLIDTSPTYFGSSAGTKNIRVAVTSTAFNGPSNGGKFSVMQLDPCHAATTYCGNSAWSASTNGCPSIGFNGGPTVTFEGSVQSDSNCRYDPALNITGAVGTSGAGTSAAITLANPSDTGQATIRMVGTYNPSGFRSLSGPTPLTLQPYIGDPLSGLAPPTTSSSWLSCPATSVTELRCPNHGGNSTQIGGGGNPSCFVLTPGIYNGGISVGSSGVAYFLPGIYILKGGGLTLGGQGSVYSIKSGFTAGSSACSSLNPEGGASAGANWANNLCPIADSNTPGTSNDPNNPGSPIPACGVLIYNQCSASNPTTGSCGTSGGNPAFGPINLTGGTGFRFRAFCTSTVARATALCSNTAFAPSEQQATNTTLLYRNLVLWQNAFPKPTSSYTQPAINLKGGGVAYLAGTVYAPSAQASLGGNCGGSGGTTIDLTLQFINYDLYISGSCTYYFTYRTNSFATPTSYGLVR